MTSVDRAIVCGPFIADCTDPPYCVQVAKMSDGTIRNSSNSLNEAQLAMSLAASANQIAIGTENLARCAREAEAKGDRAAALKCRAEAKASARLAAGLADMAKSHEAAGRSEAAIAVRDAKDAAEKARKAADDAGG